MSRFHGSLLVLVTSTSPEPVSVRLMTSMLNELERRKGRYALQTMCEGGGQANVTIIERLG